MVKFTLTVKDAGRPQTITGEGANFEEALLHLMIQFKIQIGNFDSHFLELLVPCVKEVEYRKFPSVEEKYYLNHEWNFVYDLTMKVSA